jgi:hypothetical protein
MTPELALAMLDEIRVPKPFLTAARAHDELDKMAL